MKRFIAKGKFKNMVKKLVDYCFKNKIQNIVTKKIMCAISFLVIDKILINSHLSKYVFIFPKDIHALNM